MKTYEQLVSDAKAKIAGFTPFDGWNCHDLDEIENRACRGWNGEDRRCDCGNRRVTWEQDETGQFVYPTAW